MTFPFPVFITSSPASRSYQSHHLDGSDTNAYTHSSMTFGGASTDRYAVVACLARHNSARTMSSCTIGGVSATQLLLATYNDGTVVSHIYFGIAALPTGTTATVAETWSGTMFSSAAVLWAVYGLQSASAVATNSGNGDPANLSLSSSADGIVLAAAFAQFNASGRTASWSNITEDLDTLTLDSSDGSNYLMSTAASALTAGGTITPSCDFSATPTFGGLAAAVTLR